MGASFLSKCVFLGRNHRFLRWKTMVSRKETTVFAIVKQCFHITII